MTDWQRLRSDTPVRSAVRFPLALDLRLHTAQGDLDATTVDVSANGVLFVGKTLPAVETPVEFTMTMPGEVMGSPHDLVIHCAGRIVRHQRRAGDELAAAVIDRYSLRA